MDLFACLHCDLLQEVPPLAEGESAFCLRCGTKLLNNRPRSFERPLALLCAAAILFVIFNAFPLLTFKKGGLEQTAHVATGIRELARQGMFPLAALVSFTLVFVPALYLLSLLYVLVPASQNRTAPGMFFVFRWVRLLAPWQMAEIFLLGVLVSLNKLSAMARIEPGVALYALAAFLLVTAAAASLLDPQEVWRLWKKPA